MQETSYIASSLEVKQNKIQLKPGSYFIKVWGFVLTTFAGLIMKSRLWWVLFSIT